MLTLVVAATVTYLLTPVARRIALRWGAMTPVRDRDVHAIPTPRLGGIAMLAGFAAGMLVATQMPFLGPRLSDGRQTVALLSGAVLICALGVADDKWELDAITKLAGQTTAAGLLVLAGVQWVTFWIPWGGGGEGISGSFLILGETQGVLLTVVLTVALINAMNFVDGLDGLAAGIGLIAASATALFAIGLVKANGNDPGAYSPALLAVVLAGACLGFLPHNFNPARIFMGDSGSMLIGLMLAAATTTASGRILPDADTSATDVIALFAPLLAGAAVVFVPLLDLLMAVVRRTRKGMSPFSPDKMHLHHRLLEIGHSHRRAVLLIYLWAGVLAYGAVALALIADPFVVLWAVGIGLLVAVLASAVPRLRAPR